MENIKFVMPKICDKKDKELQQVSKLMVKLSKKACQIAIQYRKNLSKLKVEWKSVRDLVSEADKKIETIIRTAISKKFPEHQIIGEEFPDTEGDGHSTCAWIIDPIDGTTSFVRGQWHYSISIAFRRDDKLIMGAVTSPELNSFYSGIKGYGALCNGKAIRVAKRKTLEESVFTTGFACIRNRQDENNLNYFPSFAMRLISTRRFGSAALDCCYVAAGILDGFWELGLNLYDVAAGIVVAREAGALVSDFAGEDLDLPHEILVANRSLHKQSLEVIGKVRACKD